MAIVTIISRKNCLQETSSSSILHNKLYPLQQTPRINKWKQQEIEKNNKLLPQLSFSSNYRGQVTYVSQMTDRLIGVVNNTFNHK